MSQSDPAEQFAKLMQREDEEINLAEAALLIARTEYPELDLPMHLSRLENMAGQITADPGRSGIGNVLALNEYLFEREKFTGNEEECDDPRNSFLNDVLDRKKGIPITLSLVYMELARRHGLPVWGVSFPGHFLVKYAADSGEIIIDPFNTAAVMTRQDCDERRHSKFV